MLNFISFSITFSDLAHEHKSSCFHLCYYYQKKKKSDRKERLKIKWNI